MSHDFTMDSHTLDDRWDTAIKTKDRFILIFYDIYGQHTDYGRNMSRTIPGEYLYDRWEGTHWRTSSILRDWEIVAIWTEHDWCSCGQHILNLDNYAPDSEPVCDVCAREGYLSAKGDLLSADGGL